ncbi:MAG: DUF3025 domain-containing protein [Sterolibacterium sp.]|nr:DUF3025 domain-containing protein [Sterolibacterium sp.]
MSAPPHSLDRIFSQQPLYAPLLPLLSLLAEEDRTRHALKPPALQTLNALAEQRDICNNNGKPLRFVLPHGSGMAYEERIWWLGEVETRPDNWHDAFNALVWLTFPQIKSALNQGHHQVLAAQRQQAPTSPQRGALRDALTQFDECGAIVVASDADLWQDICAHRWKEVFWDRRTQVQATLRVFIVGHASYDLLRQPHLGLCAKAVFLHVAADWLRQSAAVQLADIDQRIAQRFGNSLNGYRQPRDFHPLPLLGIPGATADNASASYYDNRQQFRPPPALRLVSG